MPLEYPSIHTIYGGGSGGNAVLNECHDLQMSPLIILINADVFCTDTLTATTLDMVDNSCLLRN